MILLYTIHYFQDLFTRSHGEVDYPDPKEITSTSENSPSSAADICTMAVQNYSTAADMGDGTGPHRKHLQEPLERRRGQYKENCVLQKAQCTERFRQE